MTRRFAVLWATALPLLAPLAILAACSDPPNRPPPGGDGTIKVGPSGGRSEGGGGGSDASTDGGALPDSAQCAPGMNLGQIVDRIGITGEPPVSNGGVIVDGTYVLTAYSVYVGISGVGGPTGITARSTITITNPQLDEILELGNTGGAPKETRKSVSYSTSAATFATSEVCPMLGSIRSRQFTATPTGLVLTDLTTKEEFTFTKR